MNVSTPAPQHTYALVVGIEKYSAGSSWNLNGPVNDAQRFASWLFSQGVPPENIFRFLSPLDENNHLLAPLGRAIEPATRENVYSAITNTLQKKKGQLLYIFWGGHGIITTEGNRRLFYADATQETKINLDLNSLLASLRTDYFPGFSQQICIVDACANYVEKLLLTRSLPNEIFTYGQQPRTAREQFVLLAAKAGEVAKNSTARQTGLFSEAVIEELARADNHWPPNMETLALRLNERFKRLREEKLVEQTPTYFWYRDQDEREGSLGRLTHPQNEDETSANRETKLMKSAEPAGVIRQKVLSGIEASNLKTGNVSQKAKASSSVEQEMATELKAENIDLDTLNQEAQSYD